jgi:ParB-like chromosome segregation protein Spo0J
VNELFDSVQSIQNKETVNKILELVSQLKLDNNNEVISNLNDIKLALHKISPMKSEPVDCVLWVKNDTVVANDYNPNKVASPEMELLRISISEDGYTQPIVTFRTELAHEVVDGFHRHRVGKECADIQERVHGYLPIVSINSDREDKGDRIASTIRHNRARGKHQVEAMSDIVIDLRKRNWSDEKIARELGMEPDEVLRLAQITGLAEMFADKDFSEAWEADVNEPDKIIEDTES